MKKFKVTLFITFLLMILLASTVYSVTLSYSTVVVTGLFGKSSSQSSTDTAIDYIACQTHLYNNNILKAYKKSERTQAAIVGPVYASWTGIGTKTGRGTHWFQDISSGINTVRYS